MPRPTLAPYWQNPLSTLYCGHVLDVLRSLPAQSVQMVCTSPPYWGLRSYLDNEHAQKSFELGSEARPDCEQLLEVEPGLFRKGNCAEMNWETGCHVCRMVLVFREVYRVLRDDGSLFLNYGDSYTSGGRATFRSEASTNKGQHVQNGLGRPDAGLPPGNLCGVPWRVALALQADGWILRQDIIWHKPSPMPESVTNRCTKAHEYVFLLTKSNKYFYDAEACKEDSSEKTVTPNNTSRGVKTLAAKEAHRFQKVKEGGVFDAVTPYRPAMRNKRSVWPVDDGGLMQWLAENAPEKLQEYLDETGKHDVWKIASQGFKGAHFATFPPKLIEPMILAGTSEVGCCDKCGCPNKRLVDKQKLTRERPNDYVKRTPAVPHGWQTGAGSHNTTGHASVDGRAAETERRGGTMNTCSNSVAGVQSVTIGWKINCDCQAEDVPCTVLDPFVGSGCTAMVANRLGRRAIGIDLSEEYLREHAIKRIESGK